jgi:SAM-dependent methyltransferase
LQTPAERALVRRLAEEIRGRDSGDAAEPVRILAVGAGRSLAVEDQLSAAGCRFVSDRADVEDCRVDDPRVDRCWVCSAEAMDPVPTGAYPLAFAHYVLEHVPDPEAAAREIHRVLRPGGAFVASFPNPRAPEFRLAAATPLWFHRRVRGEEAWETHYAYGTVENLERIFRKAGFRTAPLERFAFLEGYLGRFPGLGAAARAWDRRTQRKGSPDGQGQVCAVFRKEGPALD